MQRRRCEGFLIDCAARNRNKIVCIGKMFVTRNVAARCASLVTRMKRKLSPPRRSDGPAIRGSREATLCRSSEGVQRTVTPLKPVLSGIPMR